MSVKFGDFTFDDLFDVGDPVIDVYSQALEYDPKSAPNTINPSSAYRQPLQISFDVAAKGKTLKDRIDQFSELSFYLDVLKPKELYLDADTDDRFYKAMPSGRVTPRRGIDYMGATITFVALSPYKYGQLITVRPERYSSTNQYYIDIEQEGNAPGVFSFTATNSSKTISLSEGYGYAVAMQFTSSKKNTITTLSTLNPTTVDPHLEVIIGSSSTGFAGVVYDSELGYAYNNYGSLARVSTSSRFFELESSYEQSPIIKNRLIFWGDFSAAPIIDYRNRWY